MGRKNKRRKTLRITLTVGCVVLGVLLAVLLGGTVYAEILLNQVNYQKDSVRETMSLEDAQELLKQETDPIDEDYTGSEMNAEDIQIDNAGEIIPTCSNVVNILLIGADYQSGDHARSDSMILCTFNQEKNTITMTSLLRDMYVQIPGYYKTRINTSYSIGGMDLLQETLKYNFGLEVDGVVEVDFSQFKNLIDLLGGVELEISHQEADFINLKSGSHLTAGVQKLPGTQALWYSRFRGDGSGDFGRTNRQRVLLGKLLDNYRNASLTDLLGMMDDILSMVTTNMDKKEILNYVTALFPMLLKAELVTQRIPAEGGYYLTRIDGRSVMVLDFEYNIKILRDTVSNSVG